MRNSRHYPRTLQNWHRGGTEDKRKGAQKNVVRKLSDEEREQILSLCTSERFKDMTPHEIVAILAQESSYLASESTMYRVLSREEYGAPPWQHPSQANGE
jgi:putative transposase